MSKLPVFVAPIPRDNETVLNYYQRTVNLMEVWVNQLGAYIQEELRKGPTDEFAEKRKRLDALPYGFYWAKRTKDGGDFLMRKRPSRNRRCASPAGDVWTCYSVDTADLATEVRYEDVISYWTIGGRVCKP